MSLSSWSVFILLVAAATIGILQGHFPQERVYQLGTHGLYCMHVPREESLYSLSWVGTWLAKKHSSQVSWTLGGSLKKSDSAVKAIAASPEQLSYRVIVTCRKGSGGDAPTP